LKNSSLKILIIFFILSLLSCTGVGLRGLAGDHICGKKYKKQKRNVPITKEIKVGAECKKIAELNCIWTGDDKYLYENVINMEVLSYGGNSYSLDKDSRSFEQENKWYLPKPSYKYGVDYNGFIFRCD